MFIVLDGIDGAGKGRQRLELCKVLEGKGKKIETIDFPNHKSPIYKHLIHPALHEEIELNPSSWLLSFVLDQMLLAESINDCKGSKTKHFIADGYFTTTLAYQGYMSGFFKVKDMLDMAKKMKLPKPDLAVFIDVDPRVAMARKAKEEGHDEGMDIFERSVEKQEKLRKAFKTMAKNRIFCKWRVVNGDLGVEQVTESILKQIKALI